MSTSNIPRDQNRVPLLDPTFGLVTISTPPAFDGGTENARGDFDGTGNPVTLFTVSGDVLVRLFGVCTTNLAGANATLEVGVAGSTARLIAQTTGTDIDAGEHWVDTTPDVGLTLSGVSQVALADGQDIIETAGTANITSGQIYYVCIWYPLSAGASVEAA